MRGVLVAIGGAIMWFIIYASYALAFWYGVKLIMDGREMCLLSLKTCLEGIHDNGGNVETQTCGTCQDGFSPASLMVVSILNDKDRNGLDCDNSYTMINQKMID